MSSILRSEGTLVLENGKVYWFKNDLIKLTMGEEISAPRALILLGNIVGRDLTAFEVQLLVPLSSDSNANISVISMLVQDTSQFFGVRREVIGYVVRRRHKDATVSYGQVIANEGFYETGGELLGHVSVSYKQEPGLETPLLDPIDFVGGLLADIITVGIKKIISASFRVAAAALEERLALRGATSALANIRILSEEELARVWGGSATRDLTENQVQKAIALLRNGSDVHVESMAQMRQIQSKLGRYLGVRSESTSEFIPQRMATSKTASGEVAELKGSWKDGPGTYRVDPGHGPGKIPYHPHNDYPHINIKMPDGKKLEVIVTGSKSF